MIRNASFQAVPRRRNAPPEYGNPVEREGQCPHWLVPETNRSLGTATLPNAEIPVEREAQCPHWLVPETNRSLGTAALPNAEIPVEREGQCPHWLVPEINYARGWEVFTARFGETT